MNREILFRGKRVDNGEWAYGSLFHDPDIGFSSIMGFEYSYSESGPEREEADYEVDPATVGQYTGLTDKNGRKVFLGDIVNCSRGCPHKVIWVMEHGGKYIGGMPGVYLSGIGAGYAWTGSEEIIGNIHDNPELVGGAERE